MPDLLDDILSVEPHPGVDLGMPPPEPAVRSVVVVTPLTPAEVVVLEQVAVLLKVKPDQVLLELLHRAAPSPNGSAYEVACFGCGKKFTVGRRPVPGKRSWCDTCKASGEPAAQRARDYRSRKGEQK